MCATAPSFEDTSCRDVSVRPPATVKGTPPAKFVVSICTATAGSTPASGHFADLPAPRATVVVSITASRIDEREVHYRRCVSYQGDGEPLDSTVIDATVETGGDRRCRTMRVHDPEAGWFDLMITSTTHGAYDETDWQSFVADLTTSCRRAAAEYLAGTPLSCEESTSAKNAFLAAHYELPTHESEETFWDNQMTNSAVCGRDPIVLSMLLEQRKDALPLVLKRLPRALRLAAAMEMNIQRQLLFCCSEVVAETINLATQFVAAAQCCLHNFTDARVQFSDAIIESLRRVVATRERSMHVLLFDIPGHATQPHEVAFTNLVAGLDWHLVLEVNGAVVSKVQHDPTSPPASVTRTPQKVVELLEEEEAFAPASDDEPIVVTILTTHNISRRLCRILCELGKNRGKLQYTVLVMSDSTEATAVLESVDDVLWSAMKDFNASNIEIDIPECILERLDKRFVAPRYLACLARQIEVSASSQVFAPTSPAQCVPHGAIGAIETDHHEAHETISPPQSLQINHGLFSLETGPSFTPTDGIRVAATLLIIALSSPPSLRCWLERDMGFMFDVDNASKCAASPDDISPEEFIKAVKAIAHALRHNIQGGKVSLDEMLLRRLCLAVKLEYCPEDRWLTRSCKHSPHILFEDISVEKRRHIMLDVYGYISSIAPRNAHFALLRCSLLQHTSGDAPCESLEKRHEDHVTAVTLLDDMYFADHPDLPKELFVYVAATRYRYINWCQAHEIPTRQSLLTKTFKHFSFERVRLEAAKSLGPPVTGLAPLLLEVRLLQSLWRPRVQALLCERRGGIAQYTDDILTMIDGQKVTVLQTVENTSVVKHTPPTSPHSDTGDGQDDDAFIVVDRELEVFYLDTDVWKVDKESQRIICLNVGCVVLRPSHKPQAQFVDAIRCPEQFGYTRLASLWNFYASHHPQAMQLLYDAVTLDAPQHDAFQHIATYANLGLGSIGEKQHGEHVRNIDMSQRRLIHVAVAELMYSFYAAVESIGCSCQQADEEGGCANTAAVAKLFADAVKLKIIPVQRTAEDVDVLRDVLGHLLPLEAADTERDEVTGCDSALYAAASKCAGMLASVCSSAELSWCDGVCNKEDIAYTFYTKEGKVIPVRESRGNVFRHPCRAGWKPLTLIHSSANIAQTDFGTANVAGLSKVQPRKNVHVALNRSARLVIVHQQGSGQLAIGSALTIIENGTAEASTGCS